MTRRVDPRPVAGAGASAALVGAGIAARSEPLTLVGGTVAVLVGVIATVTFLRGDRS